MPDVIVIGGGLAGMAAAAALGSAGYRVEVFEARGFLGGRATSFPLTPSGESSDLIDNCQHILLRCCVNLLDFYGRLGAAKNIRFHCEFCFLEPGGRTSILKAGPLPAPLHLLGSFARLRFLGAADKLSIARGLLTLRRERNRRADLDRITMLDWLREKKQTPRAIERFWRQILVSAINEELDRMAAAHGFQVFWLGFLARADSFEMGIPSVPLGALYSQRHWRKLEGVQFYLRTLVERIHVEEGLVRGVTTSAGIRSADYYVCALPFDRVTAVVPELGLDLTPFDYSPITGIHLWFDRPVTDLPHAVLLDRTVQWMFNKDGGRYLQLVVSASRSLLEMSRSQVIELAVRELAEFLPAVRVATLEKAHVIKEVRATFSARTGIEDLRPPAATSIRNLFLAGDWTRSGWPATMEGAVRSGYLAAEQVTRAAAHPESFLLPDLA